MTNQQTQNLTEWSADSALPWRHVVFGDAGGGGLQQAARIGGWKQPIVVFRDDLSVGPLCDADTPQAQGRKDWWRQVYEGDQAFDDAMLDSLGEITPFDALAALTQDPAAPTVVWVGDSASERLVLALVAAVLNSDAPLAVVNLKAKVIPDRAAGSIRTPFLVADCEPQVLASMTPQHLDDAERSQFAQLWHHWKQAGSFWRELDEAGELIEYSLEDLDAALQPIVASASEKDTLSDLAKQFYQKYPHSLTSALVISRLRAMQPNRPQYKF